MTTEETEHQQSPFTRPGFIAAAGVVAVIVILGIVIGIVNVTGDDSAAAPSSEPATPTTAPTAEPSAVAGGASVCGLPGEVLTGSLSTAPEAQWEFQDTTAYPTSSTYGPGDMTSDGVRYCFQHSPEGAVFAAANAVVQGGNAETVGAWLDYFVASGPNRDAVLSEGAGTATDSTGTRIEVAGFRTLAYDGDTARVDVAVRGTAGGQTVNLSMVYSLVWQDGDWKLDVTDPSAPIDVANIPDVSGYISWGA